MKIIAIVIAILISLNCLALRTALCWDNKVTHKEISDFVVDSSVLSRERGNYLSQLAFGKGLLEEFKWNGKTRAAKDWILEGANLEDASWRPLNHFHNPLLPWSNAGLGIWESAVVWAQDGNAQATWNKPSGVDQQYPTMPWSLPDTTPSTDWSWNTVRSYFYSALTAVTDADRQADYARMFRGLGQQMHLLQDMSVPAHVRNDAHPFNRWIEEWAATKLTTAASFAPYVQGVTVPDITSLPSSTDSAAPNPVANLFDRNIYDGTNPPDGITSNIGLAEYTNANFVTTDTIHSTSDFPYPIVSDSQPSSVLRTTMSITDPLHPNGPKILRDYYVKTSDGDSGYLLAGVGSVPLYAEKNQQVWDWTATLVQMDDLVHDGYAQRLLPRAVGYSAALIDYFFRGKLDVSAPDDCLYGLIDGSIDPQQFTKIKAKVGNVTYINSPEGNDVYVESMQGGILQAIAKYKLRKNYEPDLSNDPFDSDDIQPFYSYSVSDQVELSQEDIDALNVSHKDFTFNFTAQPISAGVTDLYLYVVFKGTLGNEADNAIAVGYKDISEPTHLAIFNTTDYYYDAGNIRPSTTDEQVTLDEKIAFCPSQIPVVDPSEYQVEFPSLSPGTFGRLVYLSDADIQNAYYYVQDTPVAKPTVPVTADWYSLEPIVNQGGLFADLYEFRGVTMHDGISYVYYGSLDQNFWLATWPDILGPANAAKTPFNW